MPQNVTWSGLKNYISQNVREQEIKRIKRNIVVTGER